MGFFKTLRETLKREGLTQQEVARASGFSQPYISRLCNDRLPQSATDLARLIKPLSQASRAKVVMAFLNEMTPVGYGGLIGNSSVPAGLESAVRKMEACVE